MRLAKTVAVIGIAVASTVVFAPSGSARSAAGVSIVCDSGESQFTCGASFNLPNPVSYAWSQGHGTVITESRGAEVSGSCSPSFRVAVSLTVTGANGATMSGNGGTGCNPRAWN